MKSSYKLAVIIPAWNCSTVIGEMLDSILSNTFADYKVFVIDDQSTDNTTEVLAEYVRKDARIIVHTRQGGPKGAQTCRNVGLELSVGSEYVMWFDSDDIIAPYCFEQRVAYMDRHPELDFGVFPAKTFYKDVWDMSNSRYSFGIPFSEDSLKAMLCGTIPMVGWTNIYRRKSVVGRALSWDTQILSMQDSDFNIAALIKGLKEGYAVTDGAAPDYFYRVCVKDSISSKIASHEHIQSHLYLLNKIARQLGEDGMVKYRKSLEAYSYFFAQKFSFNKKAYKSLIGLPWVKNNTRLKFDLLAFYFFKNHTKRLKILFPLNLYSREVEPNWQTWLMFMSKNKGEMAKQVKEIYAIANPI